MQIAGATRPGQHGNWKITPAHCKQFKAYINQPNRTNLCDLTVPNLYRTFVGEDGKEGRWKVKMALRTFRDFCETAEFKVITPTLVPFVADIHVKARKAWASTLLELDEDDLLMFLATTIFIDGTIFADKFEKGYGIDKLHLVGDADDPVEALFAQFPVLSRNIQLYQGISYHGVTAPFIVNDHRTDKKGTINGDILEIFLRNEVASLAKTIRSELGLPDTEPIRIVWDHAKPHKSKHTAAVLAELNLVDAELPARCPELNVIENLWAVYKSTLTTQKRVRKFRKKLLKHVGRFDLEKVRNIVASFIPRLERMKEKQGSTFKYGNNPARVAKVRSQL